MTSSNENALCTCPSGDGSLSHPCPIHPPTSELTVDHVVRQLYWLGGFIHDDSKVEGAINLIKQQAAELEASKKALEMQQAVFMQQLAKFDKQAEELEAAQKDLDELRIDKAMKWIPEVKRVEDMSSKGYLKIMRDGDGDVIVVVCAADGDKLRRSESVEFCTGRGGNRSPNTVNALIHLAAAMEKDNQERPINASPKPVESN